MMEKEMPMYYFRAITHEQYIEFLDGGDIVAQDPNAALTPKQHVCGGRHTKNPTQFISASKSFAWIFSDRRFRDKSIAAIIRIAIPEEDMEKVPIIDLSTEAGLDRYGIDRWRPRYNALAAREVLFTGAIPKKYCTLIVGENVIPTELPLVDMSMLARHTYAGFDLDDKRDTTVDRVIAMRNTLDELGRKTESVTADDAAFIVEHVAVMRLINDHVPPANITWWSSIREKKGGKG